MRHQLSYYGSVSEYTISELAHLGGVSRRTVRYYVQEGLVPAPHGLGRGAHYGKEHLEALLRVKAMQERGLPLDEIRGSIGGARGARPVVEPVVAPRSSWTRIEVLPGLEVHVAGGIQIPPPAKLLELLSWCRAHFRVKRED